MVLPEAREGGQSTCKPRSRSCEVWPVSKQSTVVHKANVFVGKSDVVDEDLKELDTERGVLWWPIAGLGKRAYAALSAEKPTNDLKIPVWRTCSVTNSLSASREMKGPSGMEQL